MMEPGLSKEQLDQAACAGEGLDVMFPDRYESKTPALLLCARCPIIEECYEAEMRTMKEVTNVYGVRGGTTPAERRRVYKDGGSRPTDAMDNAVRRAAKAKPKDDPEPEWYEEKAAMPIKDMEKPGPKPKLSEAEAQVVVELAHEFQRGAVFCREVMNEALGRSIGAYTIRKALKAGGVVMTSTKHTTPRVVERGVEFVNERLGR